MQITAEHSRLFWWRTPLPDPEVVFVLSDSFEETSFRSLDAAKIRWRAATAAGVDYIASDQYELLAQEVRRVSSGGRNSR
jgi:hypothetical protein